MSFNVKVDDDSVLIKKIKDDRPLTEQEANEWIKCAKDKYYFFENYCYIQSTKGKMLFKARSYQKRIIDTAGAFQFFAGLAGRQSGKTEGLVVDMIHNMIFTADSRIGFTSYKDTNVNDVNNRMRFVYENLPDFLKPPVRKYNTRMIAFNNGSSCEFDVTKGTTFRGKSKTRIVVDEFAYVLPLVAEEFMTSTIPSIMAAGKESTTKLQIISTPNGTSGQFAEIWFGAVAGRNGYGYTEVKYEEVTNRDAEFERNMLTKMSVEKFNQEFRCHWISNKATLVNSRIIESIKSTPPVTVIRDLDIFVESLQGRKLAMACDVSEGIGNDYHAFQVFDIDTFEQVAEFQNNVLTQTQYVKEITRTIKYFFDNGVAEVYYTYENNGVGAGVARLLENSDNDDLAKAQLVSDISGKKYGMCTTGKSKEKGCAQLKDLIELHRLKIHSEKLKTELKFFVKNGKSFAAEAGMTDDLVMACVILMNMLEILTNYEDTVFDVMNELDYNSSDDEDWGIIF